MSKKKKKMMIIHSLKNRTVIAGLFCATAVILAGCAAPGMLTKPVEPGKIMHLSEVKSWDETKSLSHRCTQPV
jgi:hypothetical protein